MSETTQKKLLNRKAASEYLHEAHGLTIEASSLARYGYAGIGPKYLIIGARAMYAVRDLDEWARARIRKPDREMKRSAEAEKAAAQRAA